MQKLLILLNILLLFFYSQSCGKKDISIPTAPTITNFSPSIDSARGKITITGTNFSSVLNENIVQFNNTPASVLTASTTQLTVVVPDNLPDAYTITVTVAGKTITANNRFRLVLANQILLEGNWKYVESIRCDTEYLNNGSVLPWPFMPNTGIFTNMDTLNNKLKFLSNETLYSFQTAWGTGQSGRIYQDTVSYSLRGNLILLSYPMGINTYAIPSFAYPSYQDTIFINSITANYMTILRTYHYKHYGHADILYDKKQSIDSLIKYQ